MIAAACWSRLRTQRTYRTTRRLNAVGAGYPRYFDSPASWRDAMMNASPSGNRKNSGSNECGRAQRALMDAAQTIPETADDFGNRAAIEGCRHVIDASLRGQIPTQSEMDTPEVMTEHATAQNSAPCPNLVAI